MRSRALARFVALVVIAGLMVSSPPPLGAATTDTFRDEFNNISYSGDDGVGGSWAGAWWESETPQDPDRDNMKMVDDGGEQFVLQFDNTVPGDYVERTADLSAYDIAVLSFDFRRNSFPATAAFKVWASSTGPAGLFSEIFSIASGDDAGYIGSGDHDISLHRSATTTVRFSIEGDIGGGRFYLDNVEITASTTNLDPVAVDDPDVAVDPVYYMVRKALSRSLDVLVNDTDPEADPLTIVSAGPGTNGGTVTVAGDGLSVSYAAPGPFYVGPDTFTYTISDGNGGTATGSVDVVVTDKLVDLSVESIATAPVVPSQGSPFDLVVASTNLGPDGATNAQITVQLAPMLTYVSGIADNGTCSEIPPGSGTVVCTHGNPPTPSAPRVATVTVIASSSGPHTVTATLDSDDIDPEPANNLAQLTFSTSNSSPTALDDTDSTPEDIPVTLDVLANDSDVDLDVLSVDSVTQGANGSVVNNGSDVTFNPDPDWNGIDTFTYTVTDGNGGFDTATVTVTVTPLNDDPVAADDADSTPEDTPVTVDVLANDSDPDLDALGVDSVTQGLNGTVANSGSDVTYSPDPGWFGVDSFTYTVTDGNGGFDTATVTVTVSSVNDDPLAVDDTDGTAEDTAVTVDVLGNDSDPESDPLAVDSVTQGANGSVVNNGSDVTYTPDADWYGNDSFTYTMTDGNGGFSTAQVAVTVSPGNDDPTALADTKTVDEDSSETILVLDNDSDIDGDPLTIAGVIDGSNGSVVNNGTNVTYIPNPDWFGTDTFMYTTSDGNGGSASADVTVTVNPVNDDPLGGPDSATTFEDTSVVVEVLVNDTDIDSSALTVTAVGDGGNGTVTTDGITVTYTPDRDWFGTDMFTYRVSDDLGAWCETTVTVLVRPVNDDPIAVDDVATTPRDTAVYIWVLDNDEDADPDTLTVSGFTNGTTGTVVNNSIKVTYTPAPGWTGTDTFTYTVSDGNGGFDTATVTVTVTAGPNRPPVAKDDSKTIDEDTPVTIAVLANDSDPDGEAVTVSAVNQGAHGSATKTATSVTFTPDKDWAGIDSFSYSITDGRGGTATAAVVITVKPVNDPPIAKDDSTSTPASTDVKIPVLANDSDVDGDPLAVATITQGSRGLTTTDGSTIRYSPSPGWAGTDSFTYTITDGHGGSDTATVTVYVGNVNRPPTISVTGDTTVAEDDPLVLEISVVDPDGDEVGISANGLPDWAGMVDHGDGRATISGTPGFDADPSSEIAISASDGTVTARFTITIDVVDVNRPPFVGPISFSGVNDDGSFSFAISASDPDGDPLAISASGLPLWANLTDHGDGTATISSSGFPGDAIGSFSVVISITDGQATVTSSLSRSIADLRVGLPPELTHQAFGIDGTDTLVATALKPRVGTPDPLGAHLTPREGLLVAFGSAVETMKNQVIPAVVLGVVMAWMLMIGVGRTKEEEEPETA